MSGPAFSPVTAPEIGQGEVALFVTCLVDLFRPQIGLAAWRLLEAAGLIVVFPEDQTCCGQPNYNAGDRARAIDLAKRNIELLAPYRRVVLPSGSCAGMMAHHYPILLEAEPEWAKRAADLAPRIRELTQFLDEIGASPMKANSQTPARPVAYHDSCSGLREMKVQAAPRRLLTALGGIAIRELAEPEACCGFGGTFCLKFGAVSAEMADRKIADIEKTGADLLLAGDLGCLLAIAGRLRRLGKPISCRHVAEILAGMTQDPAIGEEWQTP